MSRTRWAAERLLSRHVPCSTQDTTPEVLGDGVLLLPTRAGTVPRVQLRTSGSAAAPSTWLFLERAGHTQDRRGRRQVLFRPCHPVCSTGARLASFTPGPFLSDHLADAGPRMAPSVPGFVLLGRDGPGAWVLTSVVSSEEDHPDQCLNNPVSAVSGRRPSVSVPWLIGMGGSAPLSDLTNLDPIRLYRANDLS